MDLGKLNLFMVVHFRIEPIFTATALDALKNNAQFKSGQNWLVNNQLDLVI